MVGERKIAPSLSSNTVQRDPRCFHHADADGEGTTRTRDDRVQ